VQDVDNDGEEEMIFSAERAGGLPQGTDQKAPLLLKGVRDFLPYSAKKIASGGKICP